MVNNTTMARALSCLAALACFVTVPITRAANPDGNLRIELISGYNFVIDSNVETPATYAPRSAYLGATYHNDGDVALTNLYAYIGNYDGGGSPTPGIYPSRTHAGLAGTFSFTHEGGSLGTSDATRYLGTIEPGESKTVYWLVSYPNLDANGASVALGIKPDDDLWLYFDVWGEAYASGTLLTADVRRQVFMRRMLSAMANKISPNGANKVPQEYLDLLQIYEPSWTNNLVDGSPGSGITTEGIWYDLGNINKGFDNDGDLIPDYNVWMQPVGDPSIFDAGCFRLVKTFAMVVIKRSAGDVVILAEDELYFSNLPDDNNGAVGYVRYEFVPLCSGASATLSPYQAVASGSENEKFNGDFGATLGGGLETQPSTAGLDKQVDLAVAGANSNLNYTIAFTNSGSASLGQPEAGLPLVISDSIPAGSTYVAGSAAANNTLPAGVAEYTLFYSTDNAASWSQTEPSPASEVTDLEWWLSHPLAAGAAGVVTFSVQVDDPAIPLIYNVGGLGFGRSQPFLEDDATTLVTGDYLISGTVFADIGTGGGTFGNGLLDGTEAGISNVTVTLYFDLNGNGVQDADDVFYATTVSAASGTYTFNDLPNGDYLVVVDDGDADIPQGYTLTTTGTRAVTIANASSTGNNFGFAPGLILTKTGPTLLEKGGQATYTIAVSNSLPATSETISYTAWATNYVAAFENLQGNRPLWVNPANALGATNGTLATHSYANADQRLGVGGFTLSSSSATITNVKVVVAYNASGTADWRANDGFFINVYTNANPATPIFTSAKYLPLTMHGGTGVGAGTLTNTITTLLSWNWSYFNPANSNLFVSIDAERSGGGRNVTLGIDAIAFSVTTDEQAGILNSVPLYDYYDTNVLGFASAVPTISVSDNNGPSPNTGRLIWDNVGPLAPGASTNVTVTFDVTGPAGNAGIITTNRAAVTNATYNTGGMANVAYDDAVSEVPATASIGDTIFWDANRSGSQDGSEEGIEGVTVELYDINNVFVTNAITDANGFYLFTVLPPNTYTVLVVTNGVGNYPLNGAALSAHPDNDGVPIGDPLATVSNNFTTVTLQGDQDYRGADFGYVPPGATIGGLLWIDFNDDGVSNGGESGIPYITVTLYDGSGNPVATNETDTDGNYLFYGLTNGNYYVVVNNADLDFPAALGQTVDPDTVLDSVATNIVVSGGSIVTIDGDPWTAGDLEVNFGYRYTGTNVLSGTVGMDDPDAIDGLLNSTNTTGVASNETAYAGVTVYVYLWNDDGNGVVNSGETILLGTQVTDGNGDYAFANLPNGGVTDYYIVSLVAPYNYLSLTTTTNATHATLLVKTENAQGHTLSAYQAVPVAPSTTNIDFAFLSVVAYDFGDLPQSYRTTLAGNGPRHIIADTNSPTLFLGSTVDTENNGLPSVGADGDDLDGVDDEDGVFVEGIWQNGTSNATVRVQVGAGSGWLVGYLDFNNSGVFDNANEQVASQAVSSTGGPDSDGWYAITVAVPAGLLSTTNTTQLYSRWRLLPSPPFLPALAFQGEASNGEVEDYRWAFHVIGGSVFEDDGITTNAFDGADSAQAGVVVNLYTNGTLVASTVTDFEGSYFFYGLQDANYRVSMVEPFGATSILDVDGVSNSYTNIAVTVAGASVYDRDFLLSTNASVASISGTVVNDSDADDLFSGGDTPEGGVTVRIYRDLDGDGIADVNEFVGSTTTAVDGTYTFGDLPDGDYLVVMTTPVGQLSLTDIDGNANGSALIEVALSGIDVTGQDFLLRDLPRILGYVYDDDGFGVAGNGLFDADAPLPAAEVRLYLDANNDGVADGGELVTTTATDGAGLYSFSNLMAGNYLVVLIPPSGATPVNDADGGGNTFVKIAVTVLVTDIEDRNFLVDGAAVVAAIGDRIWFDDDGDGVQDGSETRGITNVTVQLVNGAGLVVATTITDGDGLYAFLNIPEGTYKVRFDLTSVTPLGNVRITDPGQGGDDALDSDGVTGALGGYVESAPRAFAAGVTDLRLDLGLAYIVITRAAVVDAWGEWVDGAGRVVWQTSSEWGTAGFRLYRVGTDGETLLNAELVASAFDPNGATYALVDPAATEGAAGVYRIEEVELAGGILDAGEFSVTFAPPPVAARVAPLLAAAPAMVAAPAALTSAPSDVLKVMVTREGIVAVAYAAIASGMGLDETTIADLAALSGLSLSRDGFAVPYLADAAGSRLLFFGQGTSNLYTRAAAYRIAREAGLSMERREPGAVSGATVVPVLLRFEEDRYLFDSLATPVDDLFYWDFVVSGNASTGTREFPIDLSGHAGGDVALRVRLIGMSITGVEPDHEVEVAVNGTVVGTTALVGQEVQELVVTVPASLVLAGVNAVSVRGLRPAASGSFFAVDWIEAAFDRHLVPGVGTLVFAGGGATALSAAAYADPLALDVTDAARPRWLAAADGTLPNKAWAVVPGDRFALCDRAAVPELAPEAVAPSPWFAGVGHRIDYLVIVSRAMESAAQELADYRAGQGLRVGVAVFEDICDAMAHGVRTPEAIPALLRHVQTSWAEAPWMVVLAGNGNTDYLGTMTTEVNPLPPMIYRTVRGIFAADGLLVDGDGDTVPDVAIGRLPARDGAELAIMIAKIKSREAAYGQAWQGMLGLAADTREPGVNGAGSPADFSADSERFARVASNAFAVTRIYRDALAIPAARAAMLKQFHDGSGLIHYTGHGNPSIMGRTSATALLRTVDVSSLTNAPAPLVMALSCLIGRFEAPGNDSLGELLMRRAQGGAAAVWSPSGLSQHHQAVALGEAFYAALVGEGSSTLGLAVRRARAVLPAMRETLVPYNLLGDPAMKLGAMPGGYRGPVMSAAQWRWEHFSPAELADPAISGSIGAGWKVPQDIAWVPVEAGTALEQVALSAAADSGLAVAFSVVSGPGAINGNLLTFLAGGEVTVAANQSGDAVWAQAPTVARTFVVTKALAGLELLGLVQVADGAPKTVTPVTDPAGLDVDVTYDPGTVAPSAPGQYLVSAVIADAVYRGTLLANLKLLAPPVILRQPEAATVLEGAAVALSVEAEGVGSLTYQWRKDGADVPEAVEDVLEFDPVVPADAGAYAVVVADGVASVTSHWVRLKVLAAVDGQLDPAFNVVLNDGGVVRAVAVQADGKVLIAGSFTAVQGVARNRLARLHPDGRLDEDFMDGLAGTDGNIHALGLDEEGRIVIGGAFRRVHGISVARLARLLPDGALDPSFAVAAGGADQAVFTVVAGPDGGWWVGGAFSRIGGVNSSRLAWLDADGVVDAGFAGRLGIIRGAVHAMARVDGGGLLIGGSFDRVAGVARGRLARIHEDGRLDLAFLAGMPGASGTVRALALAEDGRILMGGDFTRVHGMVRGRLARLWPDGTLDGGFAAGWPLANDRVYALALREDGGVVVAGRFTRMNGVARGRIARLLPDGRLDGRFMAAPLRGANGPVLTLADTEVGMLVMGGAFSTVNATPRRGVAILLNEVLP